MDDFGKTQSLASDPNRTMMGSAPTLDATQTINPIQCPVCKTFNPAGVMFCIDCGLIFDRALPDDAFGAPAVQLPVLVDPSGREHPIRPGSNTVGREGDIAIADARVSRRHATIHSTDGVLEVEDVGSTNGTQVNGERLDTETRRPLASGDVVSLGGVELTLGVPGVAGATAVLGSNKTAGLLVPPRVEAPAGHLVGDGVEYPLKPGQNTFGRKSDNDVPIVDAYVSGRHGIIELADDGIFLTDIGSTNGTLLNDARLTPNMRTGITPDDTIRLGSLAFHVRVEGAPEPDDG